jgi:hypothetical protein
MACSSRISSFFWFGRVVVEGIMDGTQLRVRELGLENYL